LRAAVPAGAHGQGPALLPVARAGGRPAGADRSAGPQPDAGCTTRRLRCTRRQRDLAADHRREAGAEARRRRRRRGVALMLKSIVTFFERQLAGEQSESGRQHTIELATAALLAEMARIDGETSPEERETALRAVREKLGLSAG